MQLSGVRGAAVYWTAEHTSDSGNLYAGSGLALRASHGHPIKELQIVIEKSRAEYRHQPRGLKRREGILRDASNFKHYSLVGAEIKVIAGFVDRVVKICREQHASGWRGYLLGFMSHI
jgi:hypothetical protein